MTNASNTVLTNVASAAVTKSQQTANFVTTTSTSFVDVATYLSIAANLNQICAYVTTWTQQTAGTATIQLIGITSSTVYFTTTTTSLTPIQTAGTVKITTAESIKWQFKTSNGADVPAFYGYPTSAGYGSQMAVGDIIIQPIAANTAYTVNLKIQYTSFAIASVTNVFTSNTITVDGLSYNHSPGGVPDVVVSTFTIPNKSIISQFVYQASQVTNQYIVISFAGDYISLS